MLPIFILDDSPVPAGYGLTASLWANQLGLPLWSLRPDFAGDFPDSHQHVIAAGYCVTSGLYRSDTLQQEVASPADLPRQDAVIVLPLAQQARIDALPGARFYSQYHADRLMLRDEKQQLLLEYALTPAARSGQQTLTLGLIGREADHRQVYPATLAALQHAASALNLQPDIRFLPPAALSAELHELDGLAGVILPGGASMAAVIGQIRVAQATLERGLATLGLCLGMQSMATAAVRQSPGFQQAILAEVEPAARLHSFIAFSDGRHRCGVLPFTSTLLPGDTRQMHYNHRYQFNPTLLPQLAASGVQISAETDGIVEGISHPGLRFWHGVQGHPELLSRPDAPHPLFSAWLQAAISQQA